MLFCILQAAVISERLANECYNVWQSQAMGHRRPAEVFAYCRNTTKITLITFRCTIRTPWYLSVKKFIFHACLGRIIGVKLLYFHSQINVKIISSFDNMLHCVIVKGNLSVCMSIWYTREPRLNGSTHRNTFHIIRKSDVSSFLRWILAVLSLGVHPNKPQQMCQREVPSSWQRKFDQSAVSWNRWCE